MTCTAVAKRNCPEGRTFAAVVPTAALFGKSTSSDLPALKYSVK